LLRLSIDSTRCSNLDWLHAFAPPQILVQLWQMRRPRVRRAPQHESEIGGDQACCCPVHQARRQASKQTSKQQTNQQTSKETSKQTGERPRKQSRKQPQPSKQASKHANKRAEPAHRSSSSCCLFSMSFWNDSVRSCASFCAAVSSSAWTDRTDAVLTQRTAQAPPGGGGGIGSDRSADRGIKRKPASLR
jgi:hypothetical protein